MSAKIGKKFSQMYIFKACIYTHTQLPFFSRFIKCYLSPPPLGLFFVTGMARRNDKS